MSKVYVSDEYNNLRLKWFNVLTGGSSYDISDTDISAKIISMTNYAQTLWDSMDKSTGRKTLWSDTTSTIDSAQLGSMYRRIYQMSLAYCTMGSTLQHDLTLKSDIIKGLDWLYTNRYNEHTNRYDNWFNWQIGIPQDLANTMVLLYSDLTSTQLTNYMNAMNYFKNIADMTGANRLTMSKIQAVKGIISKNSTQMLSAQNAISVELKTVTRGDGWYIDGSFVQHTYFPYNTGYGYFFMVNLGNTIYLLSNSTWQVTDPNISKVYKWIYDGYEPLVYKGEAMSMTTGRQMSYYNNTEHIMGNQIIAMIVRFLQAATSADTMRLKSMVKYWVQAEASYNYYKDVPVEMIYLTKQIISDSKVVSRGELHEHKTYQNMDRVVHLAKGFGFGISMCSNRIQNYESLNGNNLKCWYSSNGATFLYNNDLTSFDDNYWATVNKYRLPGTTVDTRSRMDADGQGITSPNNWVGGTDILGLYGIAGQDLQDYGTTLKAKKSWFMFDNEVVALGAGITSTDNRTIETIIENRKINITGNNTFTVGETHKSTSLGWSETMSNVNFASIGGNTSGAAIGYYFPNGATVKGLREARTDTWSSICTQSSILNNTPYTDNYLTMWFDHGTNPINGTYQYVILPGMSSSQVKNYAENSNISVLSNTVNVAAVKENKLNITGANFWTDTTNTAGIITSNKKCSVMTKETTNTVEVAIADPTQTNTGTINIEINKTVNSIVSSDSDITVTQLTPTIKLIINVNGAKGKTFRAKFN